MILQGGGAPPSINYDPYGYQHGRGTIVYGPGGGPPNLPAPPTHLNPGLGTMPFGPVPFFDPSAVISQADAANQLKLALAQIASERQSIPKQVDLTRARYRTDQRRDIGVNNENTAERGIFQSGVRGQINDRTVQGYDRQRQDLATQAAQQMAALSRQEAQARLDYQKSMSSSMLGSYSGQLGAAGQMGINPSAYGGGTAYSLVAQALKAMGADPSLASDPRIWYILSHESGTTPGESGAALTADARAQNPSSTAYGIGQFLNSTWDPYRYGKTADPYQQIYDFLQYVGIGQGAHHYGNLGDAYNHWLQYQWY